MSLLRSLAPLFTSPRWSPVRRAATVLFLFVAPEACQAGDSNPYVDAPGSGDQGQLDVVAASGGRTVALGGTVDVTVGKSEQYEHEVCSDSGGCDGGQTCNDGRRAIPLDAELACDPGDCDVERRDDGFRVTPKREGTILLHAHARALDRNQTWDDTTTIAVARPDGISVTHDPYSDAGGVVHAVLVGAHLAWCGDVYADSSGGGRQTLFSSTPMVSFDLPTSIVTQLEEHSTGSGASNGSTYGGGYYGYGSVEAPDTCVTFSASTAGTGNVTVHASGVRDRVLPFRVAAVAEIVGAEAHATLVPPRPYDAYESLSDPTHDVTYDPVDAKSLQSIPLQHLGEGSAFALILRLKDGATALGGAGLLTLDPPWIATLTDSSSVVERTSVSGFFALAACDGEVEVPIDAGAPDGAAFVPDGAASAVDGGGGAGPDAGADASPDAGPDSAQDSPPSGHVVYDCAPGTAHLRADLWGSHLDVPVTVAAW